MGEEMDAKDFLEAEIKNNETSAKRWLIGGLILLAFICSYLTWMHVSIRKLMVPETIAGIVFENTRQAMPQLLENVKKELIGRAPSAVAEAGERIISSIPEVRGLAEKKTIAFLDQEMENIRGQVSKYFREVLLDNKDIIQENLVKMQDPESGSKAVAEELTLKITEKGKAVIEGVMNKSFESISAESKEILEGIRDELVRIESGENLTHEQATLRRFVQLLYIHSARNI